jgi:5-methylcytosine-specific restriction endonuclease McrA
LIKISKAKPPKVLADNKPIWDLQVARATDNKSVRRYVSQTFNNTPEIKKTILEEFSAKCAYCETKMRAGEPGQIDHLIPVSIRKDLAFEWSNLVLCCNNCNRFKSSLNSPLLINPINDEPTDHIEFEGHLLRALFLSKKGEFTRIKLKLNRMDLLEKRKERLEGIIQTCRLIVNESDQDLRQAILEDLKNEYDQSSEYSLMIKQLVGKFEHELNAAHT